jgi:hypothetical protein
MRRPLLDALLADARAKAALLTELSGGSEADDAAAARPAAPDAVVLLRDITPGLAKELAGLTVRFGPLGVEGAFGGIERSGKLLAVRIGDDAYELPKDAALRIPDPRP